MKAALHITNGDAFTSYFKVLKIPGTVITWREMLCEGKTLHTVGSEEFWRERFDYLSKNYKVTKKSFIDLTLKEYRQLCNQKKQEEIVLWFESDLFCQINMLGVLSWLKTHRKYAQISVVSNALSLSDKSAKGFCELAKDTLLEMYASRVYLNQDDIEFADYAWQLYCSDNPIRIAQLSDFENFNFPYLKSAFQLHLQRFPSLKNGLNTPENKVLQLVSSNEYAHKEMLIKELLSHQGNMGFGDSQYLRMLQRLQPLFSSFKPVKLKRTAHKVLNGQTNFYSKIKDSKLYLGGALKYAYLYNQEQKNFLKL
ncbi:DUF1835 domain-containing protein [Flavobacteriaceae bacterium LSUCC0859]|nr:DUF1835 domain-containing protein [Flavobacteriaceae bacterium LSUCC0859]